MQKLLVNGEISNPVDVTSGVPQGTLLVPHCCIGDLSNLVNSKFRSTLMIL